MKQNKEENKDYIRECSHRIDVIGLGLTIDDLTDKHKKIIAQADLLVGGRRHLQIFEKSPYLFGDTLSCVKDSSSSHCEDVSRLEPIPFSRETMVITRDIQSVIKVIKSRMRRSKIVVLASGDPLFNGIGTTLINALGKEHVNIHPNISSVAAAFAAIKEPWHDAVLLSLHGKDVENLGEIFRSSDKTAILTDHKKTPDWLARFLISENILRHGMHVLENLGAANQRILFFEDMFVAAEASFLSPNVVILKLLKDSCTQSQKSTVSIDRNKELPMDKRKDLPMDKRKDLPLDKRKDLPMEKGSALSMDKRKTLPIFQGMPDEMFFHEKGLITKPEVRAVVLSKLKLLSDHHIFWDLGAGSGSISIEVSKFIPDGTLFAVEKNSSRILDIRRNITKFGVTNMTVLQGELPFDMDSLPDDPDRIFIGGGGHNIAEIVNCAGKRLAAGGVMVVNTVLLQSMDMALRKMKEMGFKTDFVQMQVSVSRKMPFGERLEAMNPVWIISAELPP